ncbi:hypothetical protein [uncultured Microbacterium sp.]|uniref:arsenate reductase/protein-tyrosine-phosphatase family protein n=1 Tax=uncultured Microbacterium sp. TaxID=191216 RepID=UPI003747BE32
MIGDRIVVVCTANMIRSPFVAALLMSRLESGAAAGLVVESAGSAARAGLPVAEEVARLGETYGLDLSAHRSRRLAEGVLQTGDTVLCAERAHRRVVLDLRPDLISSVFTVREFARLVESTSVRASASDWPSLVRAAARARLVASAGGSEVHDDIVDPVGQPESVWLAFERQATMAVSAILGAVTALPHLGAEPRGPAGIPSSRREYRRRATASSVSVAPWRS